MFTLVLKNCALHGKRADGKRGVIVDIVRSDGQSVCVSIYDEGGGQQIDHSQQTADRQTLGLTTIHKLASAICGKGNYEYIPPTVESPANWTFTFLTQPKDTMTNREHTSRGG